MQRTEIASSSLLSIGYNADHRVLEIEFSTGRIYHYFNVPFSVYQGLMLAESKGEYFQSHIRDKFHYKRVEESFE